MSYWVIKMKRIFLLLLTVISLPLWCDVYALPDFEVNVESPIKAFVYKKDLQIDQDSLRIDKYPRLLPAIDPGINYASILPYYPKVLYSLTAKGSTYLSHSISMNYYPRNILLKSAGLETYRRTAPDSKNLFDLDLYAELSPKNYLLRPNIHYQKSRYPGFLQELSRVSINHFMPSISFSGVEISSPRTEIGYTDIVGEESSLLFSHSSKISVSGKSFGLALDSRRKATAIKLDYYDPISLPQPIHTGIGLMTDLSSLIPFVEFSYSHILAQGKIITVSSRPAISTASSFIPGLEMPYSDLSRRFHQTLTPLDLNLAYSQEAIIPAFPILKSFGASYNMTYGVNEALPTDVFGSDIPLITYRDVYRNILSLNATAEKGTLKFEQNLTLNIASLPENNWRRLPYQGLVELSSKLNATYGKLDAGVSLLQSYNRVDHYYRHLSEKLDLALNFTYKLCSRVHILGSLSNLLNTDNSSWSEIPSDKRELWLGFRYMLSR